MFLRIPPKFITGFEVHYMNLALKLKFTSNVQYDSATKYINKQSLNIVTLE